MRIAHLAPLLVAALGGCPLYTGDGDDDGVTAADARVDASIDAPFGSIDAAEVDAAVDGLPPDGQPFAPTAANVKTNGVWTEVGAADWSCLGTPAADQPSTGALPLSGRVVDFQTGNGVGAAQVIAYPAAAPSTILGATTSSNVAATRGDYAMTLGQLPAGTTRYGFALTAPSYVTTYVLDEYLAPGGAATRTLTALSEATATALPAFVGVSRDSSRWQVVGTIVDCQGRAVSNALAIASPNAGVLQPLPGAQTFYFSAGATSLPVRANVAATSNRDGLFTILNVPPASAAVHVQIWGYRDQAELNNRQLTLLAELPTVALANTVVTATWAPRRN